MDPCIRSFETIKETQDDYIVRLVREYGVYPIRLGVA